MARLYCIMILFTISLPMYAQNLNDNCENATDITSQIFNYENWGSCNSAIGTIHPGFGLVKDFVDHPTVDVPVYQSQHCIGYASETTDHYPDLWYKSTLHEESVSNSQRIFLIASDTVQVAIYYGQCGALYQSQCYTLTFADSLYWQGIWIDDAQHDADDDLYIQLKVPYDYQGYAEMCFSNGYFGALYYFAYEHPAITNGISGTHAEKASVPLSLFPNPTGTWLHIQADANIQSYSIADLQGKIWQQDKCNEKHKSVSVAELPSGMYMINVLTENGMGVSKFCKQ